MFWSFKTISKKYGMLRGWCFIATQNFKLKHITRCELWKRQKQRWIVPNSNLTIQGWICLFHSSHLVMFFNLKFCVAIKHHLLNIPHFSDFYETLKYGFHEVFIEYRLLWVNRVLFENISWEESWFLNPRKSKTKPKIMKPGMVSRYGTYTSRNFFRPFWRKFYYKPLTNRSFSQRSLAVPIGKRVPLVGET